MSKAIAELDLGLERDLFLRNLLRELSGTLEEVVGFDEAAGFISIVGQHIGDWINKSYLDALQDEKLNQEQVIDVLVDLKRRIQGDFYLESLERDKIILGNRRCPFEEKVEGRSSLCMMTSNVFGTIAAENLGYAKVCLHETIAKGDQGCKIVVHLEDNDEARTDPGNEYFAT
ncbi:MAG: methanogen output domain 1-containing protein [Thioalkalispiraceae bacterium]|jgi:predicted ArsR family transcriptional regulator